MTHMAGTLDQSEADLQSAVIEYAHLLGYKVFHVHDSRRQVRPGVYVGDSDAAGIPDLCLARERVIWAELKSRTGRLSAAQKEWIAVLKAAGQEVYVWRPGDWGEIERVLQRVSG